MVPTKWLPNACTSKMDQADSDDFWRYKIIEMDAVCVPVGRHQEALIGKVDWKMSAILT